MDLKPFVYEDFKVGDRVLSINNHTLNEIGTIVKLNDSGLINVLLDYTIAIGLYNPHELRILPRVGEEIQVYDTNNVISMEKYYYVGYRPKASHKVIVARTSSSIYSPGDYKIFKGYIRDCEVIKAEPKIETIETATRVVDCKRCNGKGSIVNYDTIGSHTRSNTYMRCYECSGTGKIEMLIGVPEVDVITILKDAFVAFSLDPKEILHNDKGLCRYIKLHPLVVNKSEDEIKEIMLYILGNKYNADGFTFTGNHTQEYASIDNHYNKYERRDWCLDRINDFIQGKD